MKPTTENQLRDAFAQFEPEVNPAVWDKISAQLPVSAPVTPDAGIVAKTAAVKTGVTTWWIAAAIVAVVGAVTVYFLNQPVHDKSIQVEVPAKGNTSVIEEKAEVIESADQRKELFIPAEEKHTSEKKSNESVSDHTVSTEKEAAIVSNNSSFTTEPKALVPAASSAVATPNSNTTSPGTPVKPNTMQSNSDEKAVQALLILSAERGFAPLQVTALTNQPQAKATFSFGDKLTVSEADHASYRFDRPGTYTVSCEVAGQRLEKTVEVYGLIPSAFSPNGDGINDFFSAASEQLDMIDLHIFDREGRQIYAQKASQVSWDGHLLGGETAPDGTYFYHIFATPVHGDTFEQRGTIRLFR